MLLLDFFTVDHSDTAGRAPGLGFSLRGCDDGGGELHRGFEFVRISSLNDGCAENR